MHTVPGGTLLLYLISFRLSRTFFKSFLTPGPSRLRSTFLSLPRFSIAVKNFFHFFLARRRPCRTALLEYQILPLLSIPFFHFFLRRANFLKKRPSPPAFPVKSGCANQDSNAIISHSNQTIHRRDCSAHSSHDCHLRQITGPHPGAAGWLEYPPGPQ